MASSINRKTNKKSHGDDKETLWNLVESDGSNSKFQCASSLISPYLIESKSCDPRGVRVLPRDESFLTTLKVARSFFTSDKIYSLRTSRTGVVTSTAGGAMSTALPVKPSDMTSTSSLAALFDQARLVRTRIHIASLRGAAYASTGPWNMGAVCISFDSNNSSGAPATFAIAAEVPGASLIPVSLTTPYTRTAHLRGRPWSQTGASSGGSDPIGGILGTWNFVSASATLNATADYFGYIIECVYLFRNLTA